MEEYITGMLMHLAIHVLTSNIIAFEVEALAWKCIPNIDVDMLVHFFILFIFLFHKINPLGKSFNGEENLETIITQ